ncbi:MAG: hypothetical protein ISR64_09765 [Deltaproteobacteria bacterium]|nr:hypothetical protein [Deltaproteobacteria bacterium]
MNTLRQIHPSTSVNVPDQDTCLINLLDQATDRKWCFSVEDHLVINGEVIVLGKLACDDIFRVAFGGCPSEGPGPLHEKLQAASMDSLVRCSALMGIVQDQQEPQPAHKPDNGNGSTEKFRITRKQLDYAYMLARDLGLSRDQMADRCLQDYGKKCEFLDRLEASAVIESMKKEKTS